MRILAVDTASKVAGAALIEGPRILAESWLNTGKTHSQRFLPMVQDLLKNADVSLQEVDGFAVTVGPGSFTGLRIGIATVKGFYQAVKKPIACVVTLDALARNLLGTGGLICPIMDARKNEVYSALYREQDQKLVRITSYRAVNPDILLKELAALREKVFFVGDGVSIFREKIEQELETLAFYAPPASCLLRPAQVALDGLEKFQEGNTTVGGFEIRPLYLRPSEAEVKWNRLHGGG